VLYVGSQLVSSLLMMTATADKNQKTIMLVLPFFFVAFVFNFPAGLIMYWITTNIWTIGQQQFLRRVIGRNAPEAPPLPEGGPAGKSETSGAGASGGGLLARLTGAAQTSSASATAGNGSSSGAGAKDEARVTKAPPPPPKSRKKKRSGRRR
jgi:YidC/Oxa1 family membrane protein insertase